MIWFITGASKGFGREFAVAAPERGDQVAATARNTQSLTGLVRGDPKAAGRTLLEIVDAENPPLRVLFGADVLGRVSDIYQQRLTGRRDWEAVSRRAGG